VAGVRLARVVLTPWRADYFCYHEFMGKSIRDIPKKRRGRPKTTGRGEGVLVRIHKDLARAIDEWRDGQEGKVSRPEAIRRLLDQALNR
jgi:hypothetical protein